MADHEHNTADPETQAEQCQECGQKMSLRACTECGHVGCCDSSKGHARKHWEATGHPVMKSVPVDKGFTWCYECDKYLEK